MRLKKTIHFRGSVITLVVRLILKSILGKRIILICQVFLTFILLNWIDSCYAQLQSNNPSLFDKLIKKINTHTLCGIQYNPSKTAAIVNDDCRSAIYVDFKKKITYTIADKKLANHIFATWINDTIATVENSCGTGCANVIVFVAPAVAFSCPVHEYRIESLDEHEPPDYYHNRPLLIDPRRKIVACYDGENNIQVFPLPKQATIHPPRGYFSEKAEIRDNKLTVIYSNKQGIIKNITYGKI